MILYHGSNIEIDSIDINKCKPFKDFGCGFYTTPLREQALAMARRSVRIYHKGKPCITEYICDDSLLETSKKNHSSGQLNIKRFDKPNKEWAVFVINNRTHNFADIHSPNCNVDCKYDIVAGPVANDDITALINVYISGIISDEALARELSFRNLSIQISFHTEKSIGCLRKIGAYYD